jgi:hypothetical protein
MPVPEGVGQVLGVLRGRHVVPPRRTMLAGQTLSCQQEVTVDHMQHVLAHQLRRALCLWRTSLELHGDGW